MNPGPLTRPWSILIWILGCIVAIALLHFGRFSAFQYEALNQDQIVSSLAKTSLKDSCELNMDMLNSLNTVESLSHTINLSDQDVATLFKLDEGGSWAPSICSPDIQVFIVIPFRNREKHLNDFMRILHPFLQAQNISYTIAVIEQTSGVAFNRAKLFNVGYQELKKLFGFLGCLIFHDVDLIPLDGRNIYGCLTGQRVLHMSAHLDNFRYNLPYPQLFGGAVSVDQTVFEEVNGFSNNFFGWGGEDDDFSERLTNAGYSIVRYAPSISRYTMLRHRKEVAISTRVSNSGSMPKQDFADGIQQLDYKLISVTKKFLYTHVVVSL